MVGETGAETEADIEEMIEQVEEAVEEGVVDRTEVEVVPHIMGTCMLTMLGLSSLNNRHIRSRSGAAVSMATSGQDFTLRTV